MTAIDAIPLTRIDGAADTLGAHRGNVLLIVNVASKCGLTPQYEGLEKLYEDKRAQGFEVLGFPANNFGAQEPGTNDEIKDFCTTKYNVQFPMFEKISVVGDDQHPLYTALTTNKAEVTGEGAMRERLTNYGMTPTAPPNVLWNFEKFLLGRDGKVVARFAPDVAPTDPRVVSAIEAELAK
jgi:glutathione peroxidase